MRFKFLLLFGFLSGLFTGQAQDVPDTTGKMLNEVVISGTRTENNLKNLPMPVQVISAATIKRSGIENLLDLLQMQTGLTVAVNPLGIALQGYPNPFGTGVQMQGMDPAYTLILIDGEPLTGRNAGILDLGRIALSNVRQIEILRGPATSLYGSDALAGIINIITQEPVRNLISGKLHYGSNNEQAVMLSGDALMKKTSLEIQGRYFNNDGWDYAPDIYGKTIDHHRNYMLNAKTVTHFDDKNTLILSGRYFGQKQFNNYLIAPDGKSEIVTGTTTEEDKSLYGKWNHKVNERLNYIASMYATGFDNYSNAFLEKNDSLYEKITLSQFLLKPEIQFNIGEKDGQWVIGSGYNFEYINSNRYSQTRKMNLWYAFLQKQFSFFNKWNIIAGARFDKNSLYAAQLSPKLAAAYKLTPDFIIKASVGGGFKAPDFRQQFLNYSSSLVGYTILGARELGNGLERLQKNGLLSQSVDISPYEGGIVLKPEKSIGINLGFDYNASTDIVLKLNFFRNDINHLIETYSLPFNQVNDKAIFSYINIDKVFTQGAEVHFSYHINKNFFLNSGYNFLIAKDKGVIRDIKDEKIYRREPTTGRSALVKLSDYKGLYNRSRHTANLSLYYHNLRYKAGANLLIKYRGKYGFQGINNYVDGNEILDDPREFVNGFALINLMLNKKLGKRLDLQGGINNLLNYTQPVLMPSQFGRGYVVNLNFEF